MSRHIAFTSGSKGDDEENGDNPRRYMNDPEKLNSTEILSETSIPMPRHITSNSRSSTTNLLMRTTPGILRTLVSLPAAFTVTFTRLMKQVFLHISHLDPPTTYLSILRVHRPSGPKRRLPDPFKIPMNYIACKLTEGRSTLVKAQRCLKITQIRYTRAPRAP